MAYIGAGGGRVTLEQIGNDVNVMIDDELVGWFSGSQDNAFYLNLTGATDRYFKANLEQAARRSTT